MITQDKMRELLSSYWLVRDLYGKEFDARMAGLVLSLQEVADQEKVTLYQAGLEALDVSSEGFSENENEAFNHEIRAMLVWNNIEMKLVERDIERLLA